jgi:hypothetical protein
MTTPEVSVLMSAYNGEKYLREAMDSILNQTFRDFEFIIVDDGSTDGTWQILTTYACRDPRIALIRNEGNIGLACSLNRGLALARGKYIARMDADDVSLPERLVRQVNFLDAHPEIGVLGCGVQVIDGCGNGSHIWRFPAECGSLRWCLLFYNPIVHPTVMMRREAVDRAGGYSADMLTAQDYDLWRRLSRVTRLSNLQDVLLFLRKHEDSITSVHLAQQLENWVRISQLMMSGVLGEDVPIELAQHLWSQEFETPKDVLRAARLIYRLCRASVADSELSTAEKRTIRRDAASRLLALARPRIRDVRLWEVIGLACRLDPLLVGREAAGLLRRAARRRLLS